MKNPINRIFRLLNERKTKGVIEQLKKSDNESLRLIADSFDAVINKKFNPEEKSWFEKTEQIRSQLLADTHLIRVKNHGAGSNSNDEGRHDEYYENTVSSFCKVASSPQVYAMLLHKIIRNFKCKAGIELGTCLGISACYQASAMLINGAGKFVTCEGAPQLAEISTNNFKKINLTNCEVVTGLFTNTLDQVLNTMKPVDYAFIDGHHDEVATQEYYHQFIPFLAENAVLIFDDISWSDGMVSAWKKIKESPNALFTIETPKFGILIFTKSAPKETLHYFVNIY